jgi:hypothetical protein
MRAPFLLRERAREGRRWACAHKPQPRLTRTPVCSTMPETTPVKLGADMQMVRIYRLKGLAPSTRARLQAAQMEAALVWNVCCRHHQDARHTHQPWPDRDALQQATKGGQFELHSKTHSDGLSPVPGKCTNHSATQAHPSTHSLSL